MIDPRHNVVERLTPPGAGAIAVVRLSGQRVPGWLRAHFSRPAVPGRCVHGELRDGAEVIDDPVVVLHDDLRAVDINLHGGTYVVQAVLDLAMRGGFAPAQGTEGWASFDLIEREALDWLPRAPTRESIRLLLAQPQLWRRMLGGHDRQAMRIALEDRSLWWMLRTPRVAIVGAPNVGKSTLANQLFAQERSITADMPGTTRDWVGEIANLDGLAILLLDTPGLRDSDDAIERQAIARSREQVASADLVIIVLDAAIRPGPSDHRLLADHPGALIVVNKTDHPPAWDATSLAAVPTVATAGVGIEALRRAIARRFDCPPADEVRALCWTDDQRERLKSRLDQPSP